MRLQWKERYPDEDTPIEELAKIGARSWLRIEIMDLWEATGERHGDRYASQVDLIDLDALPEETITGALRSCGWKRQPDGSILCPHSGDLVGTVETADLVIVDALIGYGGKAPLYSDGGNAIRPLHRDARREARTFANDPDARETALDRPVNAIGSTAREYASGDFISAMQRGCESGEPGARVMAKMYGVPQETIDDTRPVDWLPYAMGYMSGLAGSPRETDPDRVPEYDRGYDRGARVKSGDAPAPGWIKAAT